MKITLTVFTVDNCVYSNSPITNLIECNNVKFRVNTICDNLGYEFDKSTDGTDVATLLATTSVRRLLSVRHQ
jgi:hypothetical protein